ncbi:MAG: choice-of-anchor B family protein [Planctomycetota bacterium]
MRTSTMNGTTVGLAAACFLGVAGLGGPAAAQFTSDNVSLHAWIDLTTFGASSGNDCWGYTSPSGREYALMGVSNALQVVEITNPGTPVIVGSVSHTNTSWGDIKTYGHYAYVVNDNGGGGMDIVDLSDVDNGNITLVQRMTDGGLSTNHNVAIDTDSGYLYLAGSNLNDGRLIAYDLSDPENPAFAGQVNATEGVYVHDAQIVTFTSGPNAGKQIAYCANGGTGLDIYDVTTKSNMFRLSRTAYPNLSYAHQCWLSADRQYIYLNDELDGVNETVIFDVSNLLSPFIAGSYNSGVNATDHNLYVRDGFIYEAEYRAGLRVFCAADPLNPVQVGWFDSYPENDDSGFDGAWSTYAFFGSGTVLISDINRGLFIVDASATLDAGALTFSYPQGRPELVDPQGGTSVRVEAEGSCGAVAASGTGLLHYDTGGGFATVPLDEVSAGVYDATFPALDCGSTVSYYVSLQSEGGGSFTDPLDAPTTTYHAIVASDQVTVLSDDFETDQGWVAENLGASSGDWQRGVPVDDPDWQYDPSADADGSGQCYLTQNELGNTDVDDGAVRLTSPLFDLTGDDAGISYEYYLFLTDASNDTMLVEISPNGDAGPWTAIAVHSTSGGPTWRHHEITGSEIEGAGVTPTATMKVRYTATDANPQSIVEAGVDGFAVSELLCSVPGDIDGDGTVGVNDFLLLLAGWGPCPDPCPPSCAADFDGDCTVGVNDFLILLANWG